MNSIVSFGSHVFDGDNQVSYSDNFGELVSTTRRLARSDGGINVFGRAKPPSQVGKVEIGLWLHTPNIRTKEDAVRGIASLGTQRLTMLPDGDSNNTNRWCDAVVRSIPINHRTHDLNQRRMRVQVIWEIAHPFWRVSNGSASYSTAAGTRSLTNAGTVRTLPYFRFRNGSNIRVRRRVGTTTTHEFAYSGSFTSLDVYCEGNRVLRNGSNAYGSSFSHKRGDWMVLEPGANSIVITGTGGVTISWDSLYT